MSHPPGDESKWGYRRSLASRVVVLTTFAVGLAVAFVAAGAFLTVRMQLQSSLDESLVNRAETAAAQLDQIQNDYRAPAFLLASSDVRIAFVRYDGDTDFIDSGDVFQLDDHEFSVAGGHTKQSLRTIRVDGVYYRVVAVPTVKPGYALVIAQSLEPQQQTLKQLGLVCLLIGLAGMLIAALVGMAVARNGLRPVRRLTSDVERIARTEDLAPLLVEGDDEVARLATAFNQMLASLAASRDRQRRLVADAGHELRTPLTSLRTNIELLTQAGVGNTDRPGLPEQARVELLDDVRAQIEELTNLVGDLVELARDEPISHVVAAVELHETLDAAVARVRRRAPGLTFEVASEPWYVEGEGGAIERALTNLLDNAAKWSPPGGTVRVTLAGGTVTIDDEGAGIDEADLPHVFERFYRASESRAMPGSGLGLAIVAQVAERHSGSVSAGHSPSGGTRMTFTLPGAPGPKPGAPPVVSETLSRS